MRIFLESLANLTQIPQSHIIMQTQLSTFLNTTDQRKEFLRYKKMIGLPSISFYIALEFWQTAPLPFGKPRVGNKVLWGIHSFYMPTLLYIFLTCQPSSVCKGNCPLRQTFPWVWCLENSKVSSEPVFKYTLRAPILSPYMWYQNETQIPSASVGFWGCNASFALSPSSRLPDVSMYT